MDNTLKQAEKRADELQDGWEECMTVMKRHFHEQLDEENKSQQRWGHEPVLSIESFRRIVDNILKT